MSLNFWGVVVNVVIFSIMVYSKDALQWSNNSEQCAFDLLSRKTYDLTIFPEWNVQEQNGTYMELFLSLFVVCHLSVISVILNMWRLCLVTHSFTKLSQNVCSINTLILVYRYARYDSRLWSVLWFYYVFWLFSYIIDENSWLNYCLVQFCFLLFASTTK